MRAAVFHGPHDVRDRERSGPGRACPGEVVLEVTRAAICGTDAAGVGSRPGSLPPGRGARARVRRAGRRPRRRRHGLARRRPGRVGRGHLVRSLPVVPARPDEPLRRVPHARPSGGRRARRVRDVAGGDLPSRSRGVRRRRGCDDAAPRRRSSRALAGLAGRRRRRRRDRSGRHRLVHPGGRVAARGRRARRRDRHRRRSTRDGVAPSEPARRANATGEDLARAAARAHRRRRIRHRDRGQRRTSRTGRGDRRRAPRRAGAARRLARRAREPSTSRA